MRSSAELESCQRSSNLKFFNHITHKHISECKMALHQIKSIAELFFIEEKKMIISEDWAPL